MEADVQSYRLRERIGMKESIGRQAKMYCTYIGLKISKSLTFKKARVRSVQVPTSILNKDLGRSVFNSPPGPGSLFDIRIRYRKGNLATRNPVRIFS